MTSTPITTADIANGKIDDALSVQEKSTTARVTRAAAMSCDREFSHLFLHRRFWINSGAGWHAVDCTARV